MFRTGLPVWVLVAGAVALHGCGPEPDASRAAPRKSVYRMSMESDAKTLDPAFIVSAYSWSVARQIFSTLVRHDPKMRLQPDLAKRW